MNDDKFSVEFFSHVSKFIALFGGIWVAFTLLMLIIFESRNFQENPIQTAMSFLGLFYVSRVFLNFYKDTSNKAKDPNFKIVNNWTTFGFDSITLLVLTTYQFISVFSRPEFTITDFNDLSILFLGSLFQFFRFIYHLLFD